MSIQVCIEAWHSTDIMMKRVYLPHTHTHTHFYHKWKLLSTSFLLSSSLHCITEEATFWLILWVAQVWDVNLYVSVCNAYKGHVETDKTLCRNAPFNKYQFLWEYLKETYISIIVHCIELMYQEFLLEILHQNSTITFLNAIFTWQFSYNI